MKFRKSIVITIIMLISFTVVGKISFAQLEVKGSYAESEKEVLLNPGRGSAYLSTYKIEGKEGTFICIDDLGALNFIKRWNAKKRQTTFDLKLDGELDFQVNAKILQKNKDYLKKHKNLYETDIKIFISNKQVDSYNADGYSLVSVESLKNIGLNNFFIWDSNIHSSEKLYPMISDFGFGLVDIEGNLMVKPNYDSIAFFGENNDRYLVKKENKFMIIDSKNQLIADLSSHKFSKMANASSTESGLIIIRDYENHKMEIFNSRGDRLMSNDKTSKGKYEDFYLVGNKYIVGQNMNGVRDIFLIENEKLTPYAVLQKPEKEYYEISDIFEDVIIERTDYGCPVNIYDLKGKKIQNLEYSYIYPFNGNYAVAGLVNKRFTFVDKKFNRATDMNFKDVSKVGKGIFIFLKDMNYNGSLNSATGLDGALFGIGSLEDGIIVPAQYKKLKIYDNDLIRFSKNGELYGVMNKGENIILKEEYDLLQIIENKIYALKGEYLCTYSLDGKLENKERFVNQIELRDAVKNYGQFEYDKKNYDYPRDLPTSVWDDYRYGLFTQGDIGGFKENSYSDPEKTYGFSTVKYAMTKKGTRIPYCITTRGMPVPPPDSFLPTYLEKE